MRDTQAVSERARALNGGVAYLYVVATCSYTIKKPSKEGYVGIKMLIAGIDPGKTTGIVCTKALFSRDQVIYCCQTSSTQETVDELEYLKPGVVVLEQFRLLRNKAQQLSGQDMYASEVIGVVREYCLSNTIELVMQPPQAKNTVSSKFLEAMELWEATKGMPHARDAARHLVYYLLRKYPKEMAELWCRTYPNGKGVPL